MARRGMGLVAGSAVMVMWAGLLTGVVPAASAVEQGTPLPAAPSGTVANGVAYVGDVVLASFRPAASPGAEGVIHRTPADGSGTWEPVTAPGSETPLTAPTDGLVARGEAILLPLFVDDPATPCDDYRLVTPTELRALESCGATPVLGHGGELVGRRTVEDGQARWVVERTSDGGHALTTVARPAMVGDVVWLMSTNLPYVAGRDTGAQTTVTRKGPSECAGGELVDVVARFALLDCHGSSVLVDTTGALGPRLLPKGTWHVGHGFVFDEQADPGAPTHRVVRVLELTRQQEIRTYGWSSGNGADNVVGRAEPDDSGAQALVMLTEDGEVQRIDLSWLGSPPTPAEDTAVPVIDSTAGSPAVVGFAWGDGGHATRTSITFAWSGHDPGDAGTPLYEVRSQDEDTGLWSEPMIPGRFSSSVVHVEHDVDTTVCFQVRARDWVGNVSAWSTPRCTRVVSNPPTAYAVTDNADRFGIRDRVGPTLVTYRYSSSDDFTPHAASYDVGYQRAAPGEQLGSWVSPASWQHTTATSVSQSVPAGGQSCFRVRGRDTSSVGAYSRPWCISVPYDDRDFRIRDGAKRVRLGSALGGTATRLWNRHGVMVRPGVRGRQVWIRMVSDGPLSCAEVTLGRRHARGGCWTHELNGTFWQQHKFRPGSHGRLRIRGAMRVDAVAVVR